MPERHYGYKHWTLEAVPRCFNVGKGLSNRPHSHAKRNHKWHAIAKRYGLRVEICVGPVSNEEARKWEIQNIELMGTFSTCHSHENINDINCNFTRGGEGTADYVWTEEQRIRLSMPNRRQWADPVIRQRRIEALKRAHNRPEAKQRHAEAAKRMHQLRRGTNE